jgi:hypothetical protein
MFLDDGYCGAAAIEIDPDIGCTTYKRGNDIVVDEDWEEDDPDEIEEWDEIDLEDEDDDLWVDDDEY